MATLGLCAFCQRLAFTTCPLCGLPACQDHLAGELGLCIYCARGQRLAEADRPEAVEGTEAEA